MSDLHRSATIRRRPVPDAEGRFPDPLHPVLRRIFLSRGVRDAQEIDYSLATLPPVERMKGMEAAVALLADAVCEGRRMMVVADYDADGATSCAVALRGLRALGARPPDFVVPDRFRFGYGLTPEIVEVAARHRPDLLITVDNGISSIQGIAAANRLGIPVVVTDHHLPGEALPDAAAIVNPNQPGCPFPSKNLAGVGVMFYLLLGLRAALRERGWFKAATRPEPNLARLLDLVALGTVADVVPLDRVNRVLVEQGLRRIRGGEASAGVRALITVAGREASRLVAGDLGFALAPRLNAAGRLTEMGLGIRCLVSDSYEEALAMATQLDELNRARRDIEQQMQQQAWSVLESLHLEQKRELPFGLCLYDPGWHQGVVGILASRVKERVHRPVIAFAPGEAGELKGSARSVPGLHMRDALDAIAVRHPGLLVKFGGHAMAAGLTLKPELYATFERAFDEEVRRHLAADDLQGVIWSDGELSAEDMSRSFAEAVRRAAPWGQAFPEPVFDGLFDIIDRRVVGEKHLKLAVRRPGEARVFDAIWFNPPRPERIQSGQRATIAYRLDVNEYQGRASLQLVVVGLQAKRG
ncbi:MAG: single-stranded-DNA-specific exonuclease RecJ [Gammaproteobacteria bacterium]